MMLTACVVVGGCTTARDRAFERYAIRHQHPGVKLTRIGDEVYDVEMADGSRREMILDKGKILDSCVSGCEETAPAKRPMQVQKAPKAPKQKNDVPAQGGW